VIRLGAFWDIDFCSTWSICSDDRLESWVVMRDLWKSLSTRNFYTGTNAILLNNGYLHRAAIL